ncbi:hypothetical protein PMIT1342_00077 [Prochlorococcus marinus str. MIT 1342]|nr:hypothetical protein PMIT1342_00077 [Prochlorococcus marinus str. MIT 1342]
MVRRYSASEGPSRSSADTSDISRFKKAPLRGLFCCRVPAPLISLQCHGLVIDNSFLPLPLWEQAFYKGRRLDAEVSIHAASLRGDLDVVNAVEACRLLQRSHGVKVTGSPGTTFERSQENIGKISDPREALRQLLAYSELPDALMLWIIHYRLPQLLEPQEKISLLQRLAILLYLKFPERKDLSYHCLTSEPTGALLKGAPQRMLRPGDWYTQAYPYLPMLQVAWSQGRFEQMWLSVAAAQNDGRYFPISDHHIRALSVIGEASRCLDLFRRLYEASPVEFTIGSISNLLFLSLGSEELPHEFLDQLHRHFDQLAQKMFGPIESEQIPITKSITQRVTISERPLLVVVSSDLRNHPVGRFWLPIARMLKSHFQVISVVGHPRDYDHIRDELRELSDEWWPLEASEVPQMALRISQQQPDLLLDLGGHTADNHPAFLSQRLATLQVTYLGFFGPTYARCCDWWIVDQALMQWISSSYPGAEPLWALPGSSLCYLPQLHDLPAIESIRHSESQHRVFGSFNHTRKLTSSTLRRYGAILHDIPDAVLQFRSHSFHDPAVRRRFLIRLQDAGVAPHQLQPLPYARSASEAMADYGRIHLHLDSHPVSGTTTTLDALAMGIPVLTCPTPYYAGAISAALLQHVGLGDHICLDPADLSSQARWLTDRYKSAASRRQLAKKVRSSAVCDKDVVPRMFIEQLQLMLHQKRAACSVSSLSS